VTKNPTSEFPIADGEGTHGDHAAANVFAEGVDVLDSIDIPIIVVNRACRVIRFNRAASDALGILSSDVGRAPGSLQALAGVADIEQWCLQAMTDEVPSRHALQIGDRWFLIRISLYAGTDRQMGGAVLTFTNVTAFRASLDQAIYEREYTKAILNTVVDPLVVLDEGLRVETANRAFYDWFDVAREQTQGVPLSNLGDAQWQASGLWSSLKDAFSHHREFQTMQFEGSFPNLGRRTVLLDARRLARQGNSLVLLAFRDVTELKQAEQAAREADRRKDTFLATLSHELRNPLAPIRTAALLLQSPNVTEEDRIRSRAIISRQVVHMASLLDDLLDLSRISRGAVTLKKGWVDLQVVLDTAVEAAQPLIDAKQHTLRIDALAAPTQLQADAVRLTQVISNLLTNAAKYTDPGGTITLKVRFEQKVLAISVLDNGIGIAPEMQSRIFEMFSQIDPEQERAGGLGIGLALAKALVELHGGELKLVSGGHEKGAEFTVTLPQECIGLIEPAGSREERSPAAALSRRVLIADDNHDGAAMLATLLEMDGHEMHVAHDGAEAFEVIARVRPQIAILDIGMPGLNGYELAARIRAQPWGEKMMLVAVTGWGGEEHKQATQAAGFNHHFTKPVDPSMFKQVFAAYDPSPD
jgi:signal transduction histidine kinase/CheY-like chemotaxis protein